MAMRMPRANLVPMRWWHLEEVAGLEQRIFEFDPWSLETFIAELAAPGRWLQVAVDTDGSIVGFVDVAVAGRDADLMTIGVAPELGGRGVGSRMLQAALGASADAGADRMLLEVRADNPAQKFYEAAGFTVMDHRRRYYPDGEDALVMRKQLTGVAG